MPVLTFAGGGWFLRGDGVVSVLEEQPEPRPTGRLLLLVLREAAKLLLLVLRVTSGGASLLPRSSSRS